jgi:hypothetical protein
MFVDSDTLPPPSDGESKELFQMLSTQASPFARMSREDWEALKARADEEFLHTRDFRGNVFNVQVDSDSRRYYLEDWIRSARGRTRQRHSSASS